MLRVVKIGGNIVDNPDKLNDFLTNFASIDGDKILVHGGGKVATTISKALGIETQMIDGRRVTDEQTLNVVTMVYAGGINKKIVSLLQSLKCNAIGLSGADGSFILSERRNPEPIDYGFVGDPVSVNTDLAKTLLSKGYTIVAAPITDDGQGSLLNTNADTVAQTIATAMAQIGYYVELIYCFEKRGVMLDIDDDNSVISKINRTTFAELKMNGVVADGMIPKLDNAFTALDCGVSKVVICSAECIAEEGYAGTTIVK